MLLNAPWTLLAPLWTIFKAFPDLKCDCEAMSQRNSGKYFIVTTCQPWSSAWSQICPSFPAQMELFLRRSCHQGFGADHFLFNGSCQTAPRRLFHGIPEAARKMLARLLLTLCGICIQSSVFAFFFLPSCCLPQQIWEATGNQENYFLLSIKRGCAALSYLSIPPSLPSPPSFLQTPSRRFRISLDLIQSVSFKI